MTGVDSEADATSTTHLSNDNPPTLAEACRVWGMIGLLSFGGPAGQISLMHKLLVDRHRWLTESQFLGALSYCMLLPGPEAMQLATYSGWRIHGVRGGLLAGLLFVIPGAIVVLVLAMLYAQFGGVSYFTALFVGVKAAVVVIVIEALLKVSKRALHTTIAWRLAGAAFIALFFFAVPFPLVVIAAGIIGYFAADRFKNPAQNKTDTQPTAASNNNTVTQRWTWITVAVLFALWLLPFVVLTWFIPDAFLLELTTFFSKLAVVTFGGAYAVLAYLAQDVVVHNGWLTADAMMDSLGLAETTPGPLILVNEFVGFLSGFQKGGILYGVIAAALTLWVTFIPCFIWIFAGAPFLDRITAMPRLKGALSAITAAVVGVILNLSLWFAFHVFFYTVSKIEIGPLTLWWPQIQSINFLAIALTAISAVLMFRFHWGVLKVLLAAAAGALLLQ